MFKSVKKDRNYRLIFVKFEKLYIILKFINKSDFFLLQDKLLAFFLIQYFPRNCSISRLHNFCFLTGRSRGLIKFIGISRIQFRNLLLSGNFVNFLKK